MSELQVGAKEEVWHAGERAVQTRFGSRAKMALIGPKFIRAEMPDQHRQFFGLLPLVFLGGQDLTGRLWATALFGDSGFISSPAPNELAIAAQFNPLDPLANQWVLGQQLGLLGLEPQTRRRNRVNGVLIGDVTDRLTLRVEQSFGNCPKYIQQRSAVPNPAYGNGCKADFTRFTERHSRWLASSDTCFIASRFADRDPGGGLKGANRGVDMSHRGGMPGFVRMLDERTLLIPDYAGNNFFNTLGNLQTDSSAGLLFPLFEQGHLLHLTGQAEVIWPTESEPAPMGTGAVIRFVLERGRLVEQAMPSVWQRQSFSPYNPVLRVQ
jgi:predicted pyridoxine 5'-phosphate oxidase superfamily flavin-nucleotide-binding protein